MKGWNSSCGAGQRQWGGCRGVATAPAAPGGPPSCTGSSWGDGPIPHSREHPWAWPHPAQGAPGRMPMPGSGSIPRHGCILCRGLPRAPQSCAGRASQGTAPSCTGRASPDTAPSQPLGMLSSAPGIAGSWGCKIQPWEWPCGARGLRQPRPGGTCWTPDAQLAPAMSRLPAPHGPAVLLCPHVPGLAQLWTPIQTLSQSRSGPRLGAAPSPSAVSRQPWPRLSPSGSR